MNVTLYIGDKPVVLEHVERKADMVSFVIGGTSYRFSASGFFHDGFVLEQHVADVLQRLQAQVWQTGVQKRVRVGGVEAFVTEQVVQRKAAGQEALSPLSPIPGLVRKVFVKSGDAVVRGQALVMMEAMKLQITLSAGGDAKVEAVVVKEGDMVAEGAELVKLVAVGA